MERLRGTLLSNSFSVYHYQRKIIIKTLKSVRYFGTPKILTHWFQFSKNNLIAYMEFSNFEVLYLTPLIFLLDIGYFHLLQTMWFRLKLLLSMHLLIFVPEANFTTNKCNRYKINQIKKTGKKSYELLLLTKTKHSIK